MDPADEQLDRVARSIRDGLAAESHATDDIRVARAYFLEEFTSRTSRRANRDSLLALRNWRAWAAVAGAAAAIVSFWVWRQLPISFRSNVPAISTTPGDLIEASSVRAVPLDFSEGSSVLLHEGGRMRVIAASSTGARVLVENGTVDVSITHRRLGRTRWSFEAGQFHVAVVGTRFRLEFRPQSQQFKLDMREGRVVVSGGCLAAPTAVTAGGSLDLSCQPANVAAMPAESPRVAAAPGDDEGPFEASAKGGRARLAHGAAWHDYLASGRLEDGLRSAERMGFDRVCQTATSKELLALADAARLFGRSRRAVLALQSLRQRFAGSSDAATAAFRLGRIAFEKHRAYADAASWFDIYLREQPSGPLMGDAFGRLMEARQRSGDLAGARVEAQQYLRRFPQGPYASEAQGILSQ
jgi:TolA-binding protein